MGNNFQWHTETEIDPPPDSSKPHRSWDMLGFWLTTAVILIFLAGGWFLTQRRLAQADAALQAELQTVVDLQRQAFLAGDGDLFFSFHAPDSGWQAAQLLPFNQSPQRAGLTITRVETNQDKVWANATWTAENETLQRLLFFEKRNGRYRQTATDSDFWGKPERRVTQWGEIHSFAVDAEWLDEIEAAVTQFCGQTCPFLTLVVGDDYAETAVPHTIHMPSPRIFAVKTDGHPAAAYWALLEQRLVAQTQPTVIRIALPPRNFLNLHLFDYEAAATQFMAENPDIQVELVTLPDMPTDASQLVGFDGAAFPPSAALIASGAVYDLTPLLETDPDFDQGDFYEQLWQGGWWREHMWFMPQAATMRVLFYNKVFYRDAGLEEPSLRWTWVEMSEDLAKLDGVVTAVNSALHYTTFLDAGRDSLFAYAYNWQTDCAETITVLCQTDLTPARISATLAWNQQLTESGLAPARSQDDQAQWNWQAAVRVEEPVYYEHFLQFSSMGVAPFPGSDRFDGITPLWLEGSFITQSSQNPLVVWRWLKFLSYQAPLPSYRLVPARPSVAAEADYWQLLPRPLNEAMRTAFPFSRPVTIEDELWFDADMITAVTANQLTPDQAAHASPRIQWFSP